MRRNTGGGVSPRSRAALKAAKAGSSSLVEFLLDGDRVAQILPQRGDHLPDSLLLLARCLLVADPDRNVDAEHDDDEVDRDREPVVRADMGVEAAGAHVQLSGSRAGGNADGRSATRPTLAWNLHRGRSPWRRARTTRRREGRPTRPTARRSATRASQEILLRPGRRDAGASVCRFR